MGGQIFNYAGPLKYKPQGSLEYNDWTKNSLPMISKGVQPVLLFQRSNALTKVTFSYNKHNLFYGHIF